METLRRYYLTIKARCISNDNNQSTFKSDMIKKNIFMNKLPALLLSIPSLNKVKKSRRLCLKQVENISNSYLVISQDHKSNLVS